MGTSYVSGRVESRSKPLRKTLGQTLVARYDGASFTSKRHRVGAVREPPFANRIYACTPATPVRKMALSADSAELISPKGARITGKQL